MVATLILLYSLFYIIINIIILNYLYSTLMLKNISSYNLSFIIKFHKKYTNNNPFLIFFILLSGLPPACFFFIKFIFLLNIISYTNLLLIILVIINLLLGTVFYLQLFNVTNFNNNEYNKKFIQHLKNNNILEKLDKSYTDNQYKETRRIVIFLFFSFLFILYIADLYLCLNALTLIKCLH